MPKSSVIKVCTSEAETAARRLHGRQDERHKIVHIGIRRQSDLIEALRERVVCSVSSSWEALCCGHLDILVGIRLALFDDPGGSWSMSERAAHRANSPERTPPLEVPLEASPVNDEAQVRTG